MTSVTPLDLLKAIAARADAERLVVLTKTEIPFAMTLEGRRWLERVQIGKNEFRISAAARKLLES
jgi:hypothetical protein